MFPRHRLPSSTSKIRESSLGPTKARHHLPFRPGRGAVVSVPRHVALIFSVSAARIRETQASILASRGLDGGVS